MDGRRGQAVLNRQFYNCCPFPYENIAFRFRPQRKGDFFYRTFQIPLVVLTLLMLLSFAIPFKAGERIGFSTTIMLSVMVLLLMLNEHLPVIDEQPDFVATFFGVLYACAGTLVVVVLQTAYQWHHEAAKEDSDPDHTEAAMASHGVYMPSAAGHAWHVSGLGRARAAARVVPVPGIRGGVYLPAAADGAGQVAFL